MKLHLLCAMALGLAASAGAASAGDIHITSSVAAYCADMGAAPAPLALGAMADADGKVADSFSGTTSFSIAGYYCNAPALVTLEAQPLIRTPAVLIDPSDPFTDRVDYTASVAWGDVEGSVSSTAGEPAEIEADEANIGALTVSVSDPVAALRPVAGDYAGSVTVSIALN